MCKEKKTTELLQQDFKTWATLHLLNNNLSKKELAARIGAPPPRVSEAIHGAGSTKKYIKQIIMELGNEEDLQRFKELYG